MSLPNRISLFVPTLHGGGAEQSMLNLADGLVERRHEVFLVVSKAEGELADEIPEGVTLIDFDRPHLSASVPDLVRHLREVDPDALISSTNLANLVAIWAVLLSNRSPTTLVRVENMTSHLVKSYEKRRYRLIPYLMRVFYHVPDEIIAVSRGVARDTGRITGIDPEEIHVIYNPVVTDDLARRAKQSPSTPGSWTHRPQSS